MRSTWGAGRHAPCSSTAAVTAREEKTETVGGRHRRWAMACACACACACTCVYVLEIWRGGRRREAADELNLRTNLEAERRHWGPDWLEDGSFLQMPVCSFLTRGVCWLLRAAWCVTESGLVCSGVQEGQGCDVTVRRRCRGKEGLSGHCSIAVHDLHALHCFALLPYHLVSVFHLI